MRKGANGMEPILSVKDLSVSFQAFAGTVHAVRDVNFDLMKGETLAIVGESGSGNDQSNSWNSCKERPYRQRLDSVSGRRYGEI
jgi:ABC-type dipeptide/oligopeptide/nickel transport system ATPase component